MINEMGSLHKNHTILHYCYRRALCLLAILATPLVVNAQISNGVFDPTKVMVAKDKVKAVQQIEHNIATANQFNKTLGTPSHPRPNIPAPSAAQMNDTPEKPPRYGPEPVSVPTFDLPPDVQRRNEARARKRNNSTPPTVIANKLDSPSRNNPPLPPGESPSVSANPISIRNSSPATGAPAPEGPDSIGSEASGNNLDPEMSFADLQKQEPKGFFKRFLKTRQTSVSDIDMTSPEDGNPSLPPSGDDVSMNGELGQSFDSGGLPMMQDSDGELIPLDGDGLVLPSNSSSPDADLPQSTPTRSGGFLSMFTKSRSRTLDVPDRPIPIAIGSGNSGNPYSNDNFRPGSGYSPLLDSGGDMNAVRDLTEPGALPFSEGIAERHSQKARTDVSQYLVVKKDETLFEPFKYGTEVVDKDNAFQLYSGSTVKDLGIVGLKRMIQVDSGETGLIEKFSVRQLSISEEAVMKNGLQRGRPWYSILDTEAEYDEFAANLSSRPEMSGNKPQRPWDPTQSIGNGKPDNDLSQYRIVSKNGVTFGPFSAGNQEVDQSASFEIPAGAIVKIIETPGDNHIVQTESGENGTIPVSGVRTLNDSEKASMTKGIGDGRPWYSILDTAADVAPYVATRPTAPATMTAPQPPKPVSKPKAIANKPESDLTQYYIVQNEGALFEPFMYGTRDVDSNASFEMYEGAIVKILSSADDKYIIKTESGENGVMKTADLRSLSDKEKDRMKSGLSKGTPWYSILDSLPEE